MPREKPVRPEPVEAKIVEAPAEAEGAQPAPAEEAPKSIQEMGHDQGDTVHFTDAMNVRHAAIVKKLEIKNGRIYANLHVFDQYTEYPYHAPDVPMSNEVVPYSWRQRPALPVKPIVWS